MVQRRVVTFDEQERLDFAKVMKAVSAEAVLPRQAVMDAEDLEDIAEGHGLMAESPFGCRDCHSFHGEAEDPVGPDLTG
jgi:cytochrome c2